MADLGAISLWIALVLAAYSTIGSVAGKLRLSLALVESSQSAMYAAVLALLVATLSLVIAFISRDFEIAYVAAHSDLAMADRFTWVAFMQGTKGRCCTSPLCCPSCRPWPFGGPRNDSRTPCPTPLPF